MGNSDKGKKITKSKTYYCPHCRKPLMKGDVKKLNMICPDCNKLIDAKGDELLNQGAAVAFPDCLSQGIFRFVRKRVKHIAIGFTGKNNGQR